MSNDTVMLTQNLPHVRETEPAVMTQLGGLPIANISLEATANEFIERALQARGHRERPFYSTSANGQVIALASRDKDFRHLLLNADQIHADGMPMVILSRYVSEHPLPERVATTDLVHSVARKAETTGVSFYFLGADEDINSLAVSRMKELYPGLVFAGASNGYFENEKEEQSVVAQIAQLRPDILWIGMGVPKEQEFVARNIDKLRGVGVIKTCGGLFDFLSGKNVRAPLWMQDAGLEWLFRVMIEPRRLWKRYFLTNPVAFYQIITKSK